MIAKVFNLPGLLMGLTLFFTQQYAKALPISNEVGKGIPILLSNNWLSYLANDTNIASNRTVSYSSDVSLALSALLNTPANINTGTNGNNHIADAYNYRIRKTDKLVELTITAQPTPATINKGQNTSFTVTAIGDGPLNYRWQVSQDGGASFDYIGLSSIYSGTSSATLNIINAPLSLNGSLYRVQVSNENSTVSASALLTVNDQVFNNSGDWHVVGNMGFSAGTAAYTSLALDSNGNPYVAYTDGANSDKATVNKYNGTNWETVGTPGFSAITASYTSLKLDSNNIPYVAYSDGMNGGKATVKKYNGANWVDVGIAGFSAGQANYINLALDGHGTPYVVYSDGANGGKATVKKFNNISWVSVGAEGFSAGGTEYTSLAIDGSGIPFVAYQDKANGYKATVKKYNNTSWEDVGTAGFSLGFTYYTSIALDASGTPYIVYSDMNTGYKATVKKYDGSSWILIGAANASAGWADYTSLALDASGTPFIAYKDKDNGDKTTVKKYNGNSWVTVSTPTFSAGTANYISLALNRNSIPYVAYRDGANNNKATVMMLAAPAQIIITQPVATTITGGQNASFTVTASGTDLTYQWQEKRGNGEFTNVTNGGVYSGGTTATLTLTKVPISLNGYTYRVLVSNGAVATSNAVNLTVNVPEFNNSNSWQLADIAGFSVGTVSATSLTSDTNGTPFVAYFDQNEGLLVKKHIGNKWVNVGPSVFSTGLATEVKIALDANNMPFVAYLDWSTEIRKITVKKFNGTNWIIVGTAGFSIGQADHISLAISANGTPFVSYQDWFRGRKATVQKCINNTWITVGTSGFSAGPASFTSLVLDANQNPIIAYSDFGNGNKVTVKKFNGTNWVSVGAPGFSAGQAEYTSIALNAASLPYVAYTDEANGNNVIVKKYNGSSWIEVGATALSEAGAYDTNLALDASGTPFLAYADRANSGKATVKKYNGNSWVEVGSAGFSTGSIGYSSFILSVSGNLYVAYRDDMNEGRATVMQFAGAMPYAPAVIAAASCANNTVTLSAKGATDGNYRWYTSATGGTVIESAVNATYTTPVLTATTTYYVSVVNGTNESEKTAVIATINPLPSAPIVTNITYCQNSTASALTATGENLKWYTTATGGNASTTTPIPSTATAGITEYYVSQTVNGCESERARITVNTTPAPEVTLAAFTEICSTITNLALTGGQPAGGTYSGTGVNNGIFNASAAGVGTHTITYTYTANGCATTATQDITVTTCTGIEESKLAASLSLYPNPTEDKLQIILPLPGKTVIELRLWNAKGKLILKQNYPRMSGEFNQVLRLKDKAPGIYLLQLITDDEVITKRVIIK